MAGMTTAGGSPPISSTVGLVFAGLWSIIGALALPPPLRVSAAAAGVLVTVSLIGLRWRAPPAPAPLFRRRAYLVAVALEVLGIYVASVLLARLGLSAFFLPAVGAIVGLHFIGLWRANGARRFLSIAGAMCAVSAVAVLLPEAWSTAAGRLSLRQATTGFGDALALWALAGRPSRGARLRSPAPPC